MSSTKGRGDAYPETEIPLRTVESHWKAIFLKYDLDNDGRISVLELSLAVQSERYTGDIPAHVVQRIVNQADTNQDSYITFPEFLALIESPVGKSIFGGWINRYIKSVVPPRIRRTNLVSPRRDSTDGQYENEYSCSPPAVCMLIVSIVEIAIFAYDFSVTRVDTSSNGPLATLFIFDPRRRIEVWRFMTYMFVHIGVFHLIINLMVQILLGLPLEMVHGWWRVLIVYLSGVVAGSLGTSVSDPNVYLAGASGGVYAIISAHLATLIMNWAEMQFAIWQLLIFIVLCSTDVGTAVYARYVLKEQTQIGYIAHLAGAGAGLLVGLYVLRNLEVRSWERKIWWMALFVYCALMVTAILWNVFMPQYFPVQVV